MYAPAAVLTDIEGTTTPASFIQNVLLPFAQDALPDWASRIDLPEMRPAGADRCRFRRPPFVCRGSDIRSAQLPWRLIVSEHQYRYLDLDQAAEYIGKDNYWVWYYRPEQTEPPPRCSNKKDRPADAVAAVVAAIDPGFDVGDLLGVGISDKDPLPTPPPPPLRTNLHDYLKQPAVEAFFRGQPRTTDA